MTEENTANTEEWRRLLDYYEISNTGEVRETEGEREHLFQKFHDKTGRTQVELPLTGYSKAWYVDYLVAIGFIGDPPFGDYEVRHIDGDPANNHADNLEWAYSHKYRPSKRERKLILRMRMESISIEIIARVFKVHPDVVHRALKEAFD